MTDKVGVITIHSVYNYGAMLQAYALVKYLQLNNYNAEVVDYRPYSICKAYQFYFRDLILRPRAALSMLKQNTINASKFKKFNDFLKREIPLSKIKYNSIKDLSSCTYNTLITGSDQIWNPHITGKDDAFLLNFDSKAEKKIAYSSSFGVSKISSEWSNVVKKSLSDFERIGVREDSGKNIIENLLPQKDVELVLDPVFLLPAKYWREFSSSILTPNFKYILVYSLEINTTLVEYAQALSNEYGLKIVTIHPFIGNYSFSDLSINNAGPKEFVSLIDGAEYVVTNSFHGTVFSLILNKKFSCLLHSKTGTRMESLLKRFKMSENKVNISGKIIPIYEVSDESKTLMINNVERCYQFLNRPLV